MLILDDNGNLGSALASLVKNTEQLRDLHLVHKFSPDILLVILIEAFRENAKSTIQWIRSIANHSELYKIAYLREDDATQDAMRKFGFDCFMIHRECSYDVGELDYMLEYNELGSDDLVYAIESSVDCDRKDVILWIMEKFGHEQLIDRAANIGNIELIKWLRENGATWYPNTLHYAAMNALRSGDPSVFLYCSRNGCYMLGHEYASVKRLCAQNPDVASRFLGL